MATLVVFALVSLGCLALIPVLGRDFFPYVDSGQMEFHVRPPVGTRIETAIQVFRRVNEEIRRVIPPEQLQIIEKNGAFAGSAMGIELCVFVAITLGYLIYTRRYFKKAPITAA